MSDARAPRWVRFSLFTGVRLRHGAPYRKLERVMRSQAKQHALGNFSEPEDSPSLWEATVSQL